MNGRNEVFEFLRENGFSHIGFIQDDEQFYYYLQFPRWHIDLQTLISDQKDIREAFNLLSDDKSRAIFLGRLSTLVSGADFKAYKSSCGYSDFPKDLPKEKRVFASNFENEMYFCNDLIELSDGMSLVDCGAFDGDSFREFVKAMTRQGLNYSNSYCFEPDSKNYENLKVNLSSDLNVYSFKLGVWDRKDVLQFANSDVMYRTEACVVQHTDGKVVSVGDSNCSIDVDSIDNIIFPNKAGIIKMDVEGSEENAIKGAKRTISLHRPQLIISAYHKHSDLYRLPILIKGIQPSYKIYLRHFSFSWSETVIIAK